VIIVKVANVLIYASDDGGGTYNPSTGLWDIGTLSATAPDNTISLNITCTVTEPGKIFNVASITNSNMRDPDRSNNSSSVMLNGGNQADFALTKEVDNATPESVIRLLLP